VADPAVRHRGTLGGSLSHADPAGDLPTVALALDADMVISGPGGRRTVPASQFFVDYLRTAIEPDEILVQVRLPKLGTGWGFRYEKFQRVAQAWAIVGVAALVHTNDGAITGARIALTNMGSTPVRARATEAGLANCEPTEAAVAIATKRAADGTRPPADLNGQADYRRHLAQVLTHKAVLAAANP
jgi:carbon-monoxide dehydrogenase medium subunit